MVLLVACGHSSDGRRPADGGRADANCCQPDASDASSLTDASQANDANVTNDANVANDGTVAFDGDDGPNADDGPSGDDAGPDAVEACSTPCSPVLVDVLTQHYDNLRTGANLNETVLTTANLAGLHELFRATVDGEIYAQPLYVHGVAVEGGTRNLLFVESMEDSAFAFDADDGSPVWQRKLGTPAFSARNVGGDNGILSTPVIDRSTGTLYLVVRDCDPSHSPDSPSCAQRLFALDIGSGATLRTVAIQGQATGDAGVVTFNPNAEWNRPGLLLANGRVYVAFGAGPNGGQHEEDFEYHGWVFGYVADQFDQAPSVYCATPNGKAGGIWQSGAGLAADGDSVYFLTGNAVIGSTIHPPSFFPTKPANDEDSIVKLTNPAGPQPTKLTYYDDRPYLADGDVFQYMESNDIDLGASGPLLIPGTRQLVASGKSGIVYNVDRDTMAAAQAPLSPFTAPPLAAGQSLYIYSYDGGPRINGSPIFWKPDPAPGAPEFGLVYAWPENDLLKGLRYDYATKQLSASSPLTANNPILSNGAMLSLSANGGAHGTGIVWAASPSASGATGHLWAFDAETLAALWDTNVPNYAKFVPPVVVNGKVYVANSAPGAANGKSVIAFGL